MCKKQMETKGKRLDGIVRLDGIETRRYCETRRCLDGIGYVCKKQMETKGKRLDGIVSIPSSLTIPSSFKTNA